MTVTTMAATQPSGVTVATATTSPGPQANLTSTAAPPGALALNAVVGNQFVLVTDPFSCVPAYGGVKANGNFRDWYSDDFLPAARQAGLGDAAIIRRMRSSLGATCKHAYDIAIRKHGDTNLTGIVEQLGKQFSHLEPLSLHSLFERKMGMDESAVDYAIELETLYYKIKPKATDDDCQKELARVFRKGIPDTLLDFCRMFPYPETLSETVKVVKHYEKQWRESRLLSRNVTVGAVSPRPQILQRPSQATPQSGARFSDGPRQQSSGYSNGQRNNGYSKGPRNPSGGWNNAPRYFYNQNQPGWNSNFQPRSGPGFDNYRGRPPFQPRGYNNGPQERRPPPVGGWQPHPNYNQQRLTNQPTAVTCQVCGRPDHIAPVCPQLRYPPQPQPALVAHQVVGNAPQAPAGHAQAVAGPAQQLMLQAAASPNPALLNMNASNSTQSSS